MENPSPPLRHLCDRFHLAWEDAGQDWELDLSAPARLPEFIAGYRDIEDPQEKQFLVQLILFSLDDYLMNINIGEYALKDVADELKDIEVGVKDILHADWHLHKNAVRDWALVDSDWSEDGYVLTPMMKELWQEMSGEAGHGD